ncbi:MAG TPA: hypothetical protein PLP19_15575 [bacterium]|nr:hypothetical protein [bacterium]HPN44911.1 hypothetical protein [bacterium]
MKEFRIEDFFSPFSLLYWRQFLWKSQYYPAEKLQQLQWQYFSRILDHCFANVPFYRNFFKEQGLTRQDFQSFADLHKIPVFSKELVLEHAKELKADNFKKYRPITVYTSGTTGTPLEIYWDTFINSVELVHQWRHFSWFGYRLGDGFMDIRNFKMHLPNKYRWNWQCRGLEFSSQYIDGINIHEYADLLRKYKIRFWRGHSSALNHLCHVLNDAGITDVKPRFIVSVAESLVENQRQFMESWSGGPVCDNYGLIEHTALIIQCPHGGYHIASEYGHVELLKDDGSPAKPGEEGRIISTGLHNRAFPLIRYDTKDYAIATDRVCACGRTLPLIERLIGRVDDRLINKHGKYIGGLQKATTFAKGIRLSQIVQSVPGIIDFYVVPVKNFTDDMRQLLLDLLTEELADTMQINIHVVDKVPYDGSGKFKFVVSLLNN